MFYYYYYYFLTFCLPPFSLSSAIYHARETSSRSLPTRVRGNAWTKSSRHSYSPPSIVCATVVVGRCGLQKKVEHGDPVAGIAECGPETPDRPRSTRIQCGVRWPPSLEISDATAEIDVNWWRTINRLTVFADFLLTSCCASLCRSQTFFTRLIMPVCWRICLHYACEVLVERKISEGNEKALLIDITGYCKSKIYITMICAEGWPKIAVAQNPCSNSVWLSMQAKWNFLTMEHSPDIKI